ncbi:MAG: DNA alkylation repair protein [Candidatus Aenigmarchaeota archaeon]|nr:DNA alkylation repair protein [Candidatus Aenigmarchaeota archaeon]
MNKILAGVRKELKSNIDLEYKKGVTNYFNEKVTFLGVRTPVMRKIGKKYFKNIKDLEKKEIFNLCEQLLKTSYNEESHMAFQWAYEIKKQYTKDDFKIFERWLKTYVTNWGMCDDFCTHSFGYLISQYPEFIQNIKGWTKSKNRWVRRASAVVFISNGWRYYVGKKYFPTIFYIAEQLLTDEDDLVQKGYGWMLKTASLSREKEIFDFVMKNKKEMPRTALRYAIEHMPRNMKDKAMAK